MNGSLTLLNNCFILSIDCAHNQYIVYDKKEYSIFLKERIDNRISVIYPEMPDYVSAINCSFIDGFTYDYRHVFLKNEMPSTIDNRKECWPFHIIRQSEVEKFYEYTSSIVINGIECGRYVDAGVGYIGYHDNYPEYVDIEGDKYDDVIATISQEDLKLITIGNAKDGLCTKYIIPKKYIDKIILRRKYLHTDCIEFSLEKFYTGEEDVFELDPKNPDPEVLEMMKKYRVIRELE